MDQLDEKIKVESIDYYYSNVIARASKTMNDCRNIKLNKKNNNNKIIETQFLNEKILIDPIDYYYSNVIARSSNTMSECRSEKLKIKPTGTDG